MKLLTLDRYQRVISDICNLNWSALTRDELKAVAWAYYYFSVQFRENLELACEQHPWDENLRELRAGECNTSNLSPYPGVAEVGERMDHDEFMHRCLMMSDIDQAVRETVERLGVAYLAEIRSMDEKTRAMSIGSYEDGGLESVFNAILRAPDWDHPSLRAFHHFLVEHIRFDSDADAGHGALSRHLAPDDRILPLWTAFQAMLVSAAPALMT